MCPSKLLMRLVFGFLAGFLAIVIASGISGCKGDKGDPGPTGTTGPIGSYDKQIRLVFSIIPHGTLDTAWIELSSWYALVNFNKLNYPGVDSIVFLAFAGTLDTSTAACSLRLYNLTDRTVIQNSMVTASGPDIRLVRTPNIYASLPQGEITIIPQIKSSRQGGVVKAERLELVLYRK